ncbi:S-adenosyl-L-methionine-dependent methyltransferase [Basidiobolus meristosporus CBS 931.73]|uniref:S-adenosyl-L-methionine-dependent methyltransferase n=1 Tax=Basidiobolus meristosporus CBS 931.73 TaxID=1314790 RepID=A0A1Y1Z056_9FUNG|nr:S-adenosyl-L-methionine-dependent methyltransferase [Basidiobolus meristosporus CBS 931.73]|eukprot:ORY03504.1 S-adenosyl-L-methionine-dependent methyltransferase [Basidiobolus meristosporus CBS 931.73]
MNYESQALQYDRKTGGCTRDIASDIITLIKPITNSSKILDNACGTGIVTLELLKTQPALNDNSNNPKIHAVDLSKPMTDILRGRIDDRGYSSVVEVGVMDAQKLVFQDSIFTHSFTNMGIFMFPDPLKGAQEIYRTLKKGGSATVSIWKSLGYLPALHEIQNAISPGEKPFEVPLKKEWHEKETLAEVLQTAGFDNVEIYEKPARYRGSDIHDLASLLKESFYSHLTKSWSPEQTEKWDAAVLEVLKNPKIAQHGDDGSVSLPMVAWVAVATK